MQERIVLLKRVRHQRQHLLVLIEQQTRGQMAQPLVGETWGSKEFEAFYLTEMCSLAEGEKVEELCDIVPPASRGPSSCQHCSV